MHVSTLTSVGMRMVAVRIHAQINSMHRQFAVVQRVWWWNRARVTASPIPVFTTTASMAVQLSKVVRDANVILVISLIKMAERVKNLVDVTWTMAGASLIVC